jgi:hypothetical protein
MAGQEGLVALALAFEGFQLRGYIDGSIVVVANVKRYDANGVTSDEEFVAFFVVEDEGEDAAELFEHSTNLLMRASALLSFRREGGGEASIESEDYLAVASRLEVVLADIATTYLLVVIDFAIHGEDLLLVGGVEGLSARFGVDDAQSLVGEDG